MKAYSVRDKYSCYCAVVFAESPSKAKTIAMSTDACDDSHYTDIRAQRLPALDKYYRGLSEMDWYDDNDRIALVKDGGFNCDDTSECKTCSAKQYCNYCADDEVEKCTDDTGK